MSEGDATLDELLRGRLRLWQPRVGYRINVDSLLLAHFASAVAARAKPPRTAVDLCAGVGVIGLALAAALPALEVWLAELQPAMAALARRNVDENGLAARARVIEVDLADAAAARAALPGARFDLAVSSPPYFTTAAGPTVPDGGEAIARHELRLDLPALAAQAKRLLTPGGRACLVFPSERLLPLLAALDGATLRPTRLRAIHPHPGAPANRVLVEAQKGSRAGLTVEEPLWLRDASGGYSDEARVALNDPR